MPLPVFVISASGATPKQDAMRRRLAGFGLEPQFVEPELGPLTGEDPGARRSLALFGRALNPAEVARHFAHRSAYQQILDLDTPGAVILEDDTVLEADFARVLSRIEPILDLADMFRLAGATQKRKGRMLMTLDERHTLDRLADAQPSLAAYVVTRAGAQKALDYTQALIYPIEVALTRVWENGIDQLAVTPYPAHRDPDAGAEPAPYANFPSHSGGLAARLQLWLRRQYDSFARRGYFLLKVGPDARTARLAVERIGHVEPFAD